MKRRKFINNSVQGALGLSFLPYLSEGARPKSSAFIDRILPAPKNGGFQDPDYWIWGSSVIKGEDGKYHMFASRWSKEVSFGCWVTNSEVVRAVSNTPVGPYTFQEVVLPIRGKGFFDGLVSHNPRVIKYKDKYLLYYFGTTYNFPVPNAQNPKINRDKFREAWMNKRIGMAVSDSIHGPWKRMDKPVIEPRPGKWDSSITSNPAPVVNPLTNEILLMYKSSSDGPQPPLLLGVSKAKKPAGPYKRLSDEPIFRFETKENQDNDVEDPYVWWEKDHYEVIIKDRFGHVCGEEGGGVHGWSKDGVSWQLYKNLKAYSRDVLWDDGTTIHQNHFERPFLLIEGGKPTHLFAATGTGPKAWSFDKTWNMVIPLKTDL